LPVRIASAAETTEQRVRAFIERLAATLDTVFPSVVIESGAPPIDEPASAYDARPKPDFVKADDEGWDVPGI